MANSYNGSMPAGESSPRVSVVMPAYNAAAYIGEAIQSVLAQTFTGYEIVVVNDGSPDTEELERVLEPYRSRIVYIPQENRGPSSARNTGIMAARGELIGFLDADDGWEPDFLASQIAILDADPSITLLYADAVVFGESPLAGRRVMELSPSHGDVTFYKILSRESTIFLSTSVAKREAILKAGMFDEAFRRAEDADLWLRIVKHGGRIAYQRRVLARYRRRADNLSSDGTKMIDGYVRVLTKLRDYPGMTPEEVRAIERQINEERARYNLFKARQCFVDGRFSKSREFLQEANAYLRKPSFAIASFLMKLAPGILWRAYQFRHRLLSVKTLPS